MSAVPASNQALLQIVGSATPDTIDGVIQLMTAIESVLPDTDGLKWFNWLYLEVTRAVKNARPAGWNDPRWINRLDVVFAGFYFAAIRCALTKTKNPKSWDVLFQARFLPAVDRIQFALAGMNAHINHDLSLALIQTDKEFGIRPSHNSPEHADYESVNVILDNLFPVVLETLATGLIGEVLQDSGKIGRLLAMWNVRAARDMAWDFADHLRLLSGPVRDFALASQDQFTGALGRSILLMV